MQETNAAFILGESDATPRLRGDSQRSVADLGVDNLKNMLSQKARWNGKKTRRTK